MRVEILPIRGAKELPVTLESRVLFDFTGAHIFVLIDNMQARAIHDVWERAQLELLTEGAGQAGVNLRRALGRSTGERKFLAQWMSRALERGLDRACHSVWP